MNQDNFKRRLTAIVSADVVGYSRLMGDDEEVTVSTLTDYREAITRLVGQYRGRVVDSPGDNILAEFPSVVDAVRCSIDIQSDNKARNAQLPEHRKMVFRIGINLGDVIEDEDRIYGDGVNIAARLESLAEGGGICISGTVYDHVENKIRLGYEYMGEHSVKNIVNPIRVYKIPLEMDTIPSSQISPPDFQEKPSIAVLPFNNMSEGPDQEYFSDGISEDIITSLSMVPNLFVIARNSSFIYKNTPVNVRQVGKELGVRYILEGSVRKSGNRVRITAQLIDVETGGHVWAERYDRNLKDIFELQDEITMSITTAMQVKLTEGEQARFYGKDTNNLEAYLKLLQGREYFHKMNKEDNIIARQMFEQSIALDSDYAIAYCFLAQTYNMDVQLGQSDSPLKSYEKAMEISEKALSLNDALPGIHGLMGVLYTMQHQHDKAIAEGEIAINMNPNSITDHQFISITFIFAGMPEKAISLLEKSRRINPFPDSSFFLILGFAYREAEKYEEAVSALRRSIQLEPNNLMTHIHLTAAYAAAGHIKNAKSAAKEVIRINPNFSLDFFINTRPFKNHSDQQRLHDALNKAGFE